MRGDPPWEDEVELCGAMLVWRRETMGGVVWSDKKIEREAEGLRGIDFAVAYVELGRPLRSSPVFRPIKYCVRVRSICAPLRSFSFSFSFNYSLHIINLSKMLKSHP